MTIEPVSSRFLADKSGIQPAPQKIFLKNQ